MEYCLNNLGKVNLLQTILESENSSNHTSQKVSISLGSMEQFLQLKVRTPSGTVISKSVKVMSKLFTREKSVETNSGKKSPKFKMTMAKGVKNSQSSNQRNSVNKQLERKLKVKTGRVALRRENQNKHTKTDNHDEVLIDNSQPDQLLSDSSFEEEGYYTPTSEVDLEKDQGKQFCYQLSIPQNYTPINNSMNKEMKEEGESGNATSMEETSIKEATQPQVVENEAPMEVEKVTDVDFSPQLLCAQTIHEMFYQLKTKISTLDQKVEQMSEEKGKEMSKTLLEKCKEEIDQAVTESVSNRTEQDQKEFNSIKSDFRHFKHRNRALTNIVDFMATEIEDLKARMDNCELNIAKKAISISGIYLPMSKKDAISQLESFLFSKLNVRVDIEDLFWTGTQELKTAVAFLQSSKQKAFVMQEKSHLKDVRNRKGEKIFVNDYSPVNTQEKQFRQNQILMDISKSDVNFSVKFKKGKMMIQGETYKQKVVPPNPRQIVDLSPGDFDTILKMELNQNGRIKQDKSIFEGFTANVNSQVEIRQLYIKVKLMQPAARHIVCAYILPGAETYFNQDYCNDGEAGAGRHLCDIAKLNDFAVVLYPCPILLPLTWHHHDLAKLKDLTVVLYPYHSMLPLAWH